MRTRLQIILTLFALAEWTEKLSAQTFYLVGPGGSPSVGPCVFSQGSSVTLGNTTFTMGVSGSRFLLRAENGSTLGPFNYQPNGQIVIGRQVLMIKEVPTGVNPSAFPGAVGTPGGTSLVPSFPGGDPRNMTPAQQQAYMQAMQAYRQQSQPVPSTPNPGYPNANPGNPFSTFQIGTLPQPRSIQLDPNFQQGIRKGSREVEEELRNLLDPHGQAVAEAQTSSRYPMVEDLYYLQPLREVVAKLNLSIRSNFELVCPGFPADSFTFYPADFRTADGFNKLILVSDKGGQLVALQQVDEAPRTASLIPPSGGQLYNIIMTRTLSAGYRMKRLVQPTGAGIQVDTELIGQDGQVRERTRLFLPQPMINLILWNIEREDSGKGSFGKKKTESRFSSPFGQ